ncbi:MAG TPA: GNAT family N-acetyltransferase [Chondromyces sp.]|nr:GNAT family N-acetyltransferase [Chondromyces sp.]
MHIRHGDIQELERAMRASDVGWLRDTCAVLRGLPKLPPDRILVAEEEDRLRAVLGLELEWAPDGCLARAAILVLAVDPKHGGRGLGTRLVRFAEGIARIHGCPRVEAAPACRIRKHGRCSRGTVTAAAGPA